MQQNLERKDILLSLFFSSSQLCSDPSFKLEMCKDWENKLHESSKPQMMERENCKKNRKCFYFYTEAHRVSYSHHQHQKNYLYTRYTTLTKIESAKWEIEKVDLPVLQTTKKLVTWNWIIKDEADQKIIYVR